MKPLNQEARVALVSLVNNYEYDLQLIDESKQGEWILSHCKKLPYDKETMPYILAEMILYILELRYELT